MLQFFEWFWKAIGLSAALGLEENESFQGFFHYFWKQYSTAEQTTYAAIFLVTGFLLMVIIPYLLGGINTAIILSKYKYHDDIRNHGSGNAGLTNMHRVFGTKAAAITLIGDILKQFISVIVGIVIWGELGAYLAGSFCMLGHIAPIYFHFKGGKGVLTAGTLILLVNYRVFLVAITIFALTVLITRYVSLGSVIAGFSLPAIVYMEAVARGTVPDLFAWGFSIFIGLLLIVMHRENIKRIYNGTENKLTFKKKDKKESEK